MYSRWTELFEIELIIYIKMDLALNNLQRLICQNTQPTNQPMPSLIGIIVHDGNKYGLAQIITLYC